MINEVRKVSGDVCFGGPISYGKPVSSSMLIPVPQHAWAQSGTIRDNITFSSNAEDVDLGRVHEIIEACGLSTDLTSLTAGDLYVIS